MRNLLLALAALALIGVACERNTGEIGLDFVDQNSLKIGKLESLEVVATTEAFDSLVTEKPVYLMLGSYEDPVFGKAAANFATQVILSTMQPDFGENPTVDSVFMYLPFIGFYGDTAAPFGLTVKQLDQPIFADSTYYAHSVFSGSTVLADTVVQPQPSRKRRVPGMVAPNEVIGLRLNTAFFQSQIVDASSDSSADFSSNTNFLEYFRGIYVEGHADNQAIYQFSPGDQDMRIRFFFSNDSLRADTVGPGYSVYDLLAWNVVKSANTFAFDKTQADFDFDAQDTVAGELTTYVQGMGGAMTVVRLTGLQALKDSNYFVNYAELRIPVREGSALTYANPAKLTALLVSGNDRSLLTGYVNGDPGGQLVVSSPLRDRAYTLEITKFVQQWLNGKDSNEAKILLVPDRMSSSAARAVLNGNLDPFDPIRVDLYVTKPR
ncbi:MAG TPA: hypothetical protein DCE58_04695 [Cryomorphaceae bacterium]|nr:hypothetical protein [Cryomorphaceae bacterium]